MTLADLDVVKVIVPAGRVPNGATVTKRNGTNVYTVAREIRVYMQERVPPTVVKAEDGGVFLLNGGPSVSCVSGTTELVWHADPDSLVRALVMEEDK